MCSPVEEPVLAVETNPVVADRSPDLAGLHRAAGLAEVDTGSLVDNPDRAPAAAAEVDSQDMH